MNQPKDSKGYLIEDAVYYFAELALKKNKESQTNPLGYFVLALMAGAYVGFGILLILTLGQMAEPSWRALVMGVSFGIALTLVKFAGSELFTGYAMYYAIGRLVGSITWGQLIKAWLVTWIGNFIGAFILAGIFVLSAGDIIHADPAHSLLFTVAEKKMSTPDLQLFMRGILCNWLVCLALWTSERVKEDITKAVVIFWCLFAFIACGFEHSIANMTVFSLALLTPDHPATLTWGLALHNLIIVTVGNLLAGTVMMGGAYWLAAGRPRWKS